MWTAWNKGSGEERSVEIVNTKDTQHEMYWKNILYKLICRWYRTFLSEKWNHRCSKDTKDCYLIVNKIFFPPIHTHIYLQRIAKYNKQIYALTKNFLVVISTRTVLKTIQNTRSSHTKYIWHWFDAAENCLCTFLCFVPWFFSCCSQYSVISKPQTNNKTHQPKINRSEV